MILNKMVNDNADDNDYDDDDNGWHYNNHYC